MGHHSRAWSLIGQAVRIALDLQLDRAPDPVASLSKAKTRAKHVILGCFALDTLIAARLARIPHLRAQDIDQIGLVEEDGLEEWDPWTDCLNIRRNKFSGFRGPSAILSTFNRCIEVLKILNEATCLPTGNSGHNLSTVLLEKLHLWSHSQRSPLYFDSSSSGSEMSHLLPHQFHLHNLYFATLATSQLLSHTTGDSVVNLEPCTRSARHTVELLKQQSQSFGLLAAPPTYDCYVSKAYEIVRAVNTSIEGTNILMNDWKRNLDHCIDSLESAWPVFESFKSTTSYHSNLGSAGEDGTVAHGPQSRNGDGDTPMEMRTPQSLTNYTTMAAHSPQALRPQAEGIQRTRGSSQSRAISGKMNHRASFGPSSGQGLPQNPLTIYENAHVTFGGLDRRLDRAAAAKAVLQQASSGKRPTFDLPQPANPQLHRSLTMSSADVEFDPIFNELMRLDATEW